MQNQITPFTLNHQGWWMSNLGDLKWKESFDLAFAIIEHFTSLM